MKNILAAIGAAVVLFGLILFIGKQSDRDCYADDTIAYSFCKRMNAYCNIKKPVPADYGLTEADVSEK